MIQHLLNTILAFMDYFKNFWNPNQQPNLSVEDRVENILKSIVFEGKLEIYWEIRINLAFLLATISLCFNQFIVSLLFGIQSIILFYTIICSRNQFNIKPNQVLCFVLVNMVALLAILILMIIFYYKILANEDCFELFSYYVKLNMSSDCIRSYASGFLMCFVSIVSATDSYVLLDLVEFYEERTQLQEEAL